MYSNSPLIDYQRLTDKCYKDREHEIDTITIHCYVGQVTAEQGCNYIYNTVRDMSANYVVGYDGSIALCVPEKSGSWCTSNQDNDMRAITIETACEVVEPYVITDKAFRALVDLCADICKRNQIKRLLWENNPDFIGQTDKQNITLHRWFAATACPGDYIVSMLPELCKRVNSKLEQASRNKLYRVQVGAFRDKQNAINYQGQLMDKGFPAFIVEVETL